MRDYLIHCYEVNLNRDQSIEEALAAIRKYPEYRQQSLDIQAKLESDITYLRERLEENSKQLLEMKNEERRRECNKLRDRLLQSYRYYTNPQHNPNQAWTSMEAEAFWELFSDYEQAGGDGYMHTVV